MSEWKTCHATLLTLSRINRKSQIAIEYCYRFRDMHPASNVFWVHASTAERFEQAYKDIARRGRLPGWDDHIINVLEIVADWLISDELWLMIIDNTDDKDVLFDQRLTTASRRLGAQDTDVSLSTYLLQISRRGSILITSRNTNTIFRLVNVIESIIKILYISGEDIVVLLCNKLPNHRLDKVDKADLIKLLDHLPLTIT